jgi:2-dehydropantoate 2-reductase
MGAGAIGCYLGGRLAAAGADVVLVGRAALAGEIAQHGLSLTDYRGAELRIAPERLTVATDAAALAGCDFILVTVKGGDTESAGALLAPFKATIISFQNGLHNAHRLRAALPGRSVLAGMVPFNVLREREARFHQGTNGRLAVERGASALVTALRAAGLPADEHDDMLPVQWGKLLVNLNNSVNALSGIPIQQMLAQRDYRRVMAACVREALSLLGAAGIRPVLEVKLPPRLVPSVLELPNWIFLRLARAMMHVDPQARSSMWDDLERGRKTEIDALNGEVVRLAERLGRAAPVNARIVELVRAAEGQRSPCITAPELRARVGV